MKIKRFKEFNETLLSDTRYNDVLKKDIEDDDTLREYCPCEEVNSCDCDGDCNCDFCNLYNKDNPEKDYLMHEPQNTHNSLTGRTDMGGLVGSS